MFSPISSHGTVVEALGPRLKIALAGGAIGELLAISRHSKGKPALLAEIVGFSGEHVIASPFERTDGIIPGAEVELLAQEKRIALGDFLLGKVVDSSGNILHPENISEDLEIHCRKDPYSLPAQIFERSSLDEVFETGVTAIDSLLTVAKGQRIAVLAEPGVGKSTLLSMLAENASADVVVIGLIGERAREVVELSLEQFANESRARTTIVASTSSEAAICRVNAAYTATTIAEHFRDQGKNVLLLVDSLTRLFRAYREVGLAAGEVPIRRGYPPSVFSRLPELIERAGVNSRGSITAFYSLLLSGELDQDPMVEEIKGLCDGHFFLSKELAEQGVFPAIDIPASISRLSSQVLENEAADTVSKARRYLLRLKDDKELLALGGEPDEELQEALALENSLKQFLQQKKGSVRNRSEALNQLSELLALGEIPSAPDC